MYYHETMDIEEARHFFNSRIHDIKIGSEMDKTQMMLSNNKLDELYTDVCVDFSFWKTRLDIIESKINQVEKGESTHGSNTEYRRARAIKIVQNFPLANFDDLNIDSNYDYLKSDVEKVNLYGMRDTALEWFLLYKTVIDTIDFKSNRLIIVATSLKVESNIAR